MKRLIAWRILVDEKGRSVLAVGGIFVAFLLIFLQLGFYFSVPKGGLLFYDRMQFDLMLVSSAYVSQAHSGEFPRRRLYQAFALPEVARTTALYQANGKVFSCSAWYKVFQYCNQGVMTDRLSNYTLYAAAEFFADSLALAAPE